uniref:SKICH domain-containing protein n=1 Tax=Astyanax mexicanus TaxID=7994 RepID=A0A3B1IVR7_ASTMX
MEKPWKVKFRNVGQTYFPQTRVECRYTISGHHKWSSHDWIGLFKVGWTSVRDYYTFAWALAPEGYTSGTNVNCSVLFQRKIFCFLGLGTTSGFMGFST